MRQLTLILILCAAAPLHANDTALTDSQAHTRYDMEPRILVGPAGGGLFSNYFLGMTISAEFPVPRAELDVTDTIAPEIHSALGSGFSNVIAPGARIWFTRPVGLYVRTDHSAYSVTRVSKSADYLFAGLTWRTMAWENPTRFSFSYIREYNNGIAPDGVESSHLQGGDFTLETSLGCARHFCTRFNATFEAGRVLEQGNPQCDGARGHCPCPRIPSVGGGASLSFLFEFPKRKERLF